MNKNLHVYHLALTTIPMIFATNNNQKKMHIFINIHLPFLHAEGCVCVRTVGLRWCNGLVVPCSSTVPIPWVNGYIHCWVSRLKSGRLPPISPIPVCYHSSSLIEEGEFEMLEWYNNDQVHTWQKEERRHKENFNCYTLQWYSLTSSRCRNDRGSGKQNG